MAEVFRFSATLKVVVLKYKNNFTWRPWKYSFIRRKKTVVFISHERFQYFCLCSCSSCWFEVGRALLEKWCCVSPCTNQDLAIYTAGIVIEWHVSRYKYERINVKVLSYFWGHFHLHWTVLVKRQTGNSGRAGGGGYDMQQRSPARTEMTTLQLHGIHCNHSATKRSKVVL